MKLLILYASNSGSTLSVANTIYKVLLEDFNEIKLENANNFDVTQFTNYDVILIGSPSWLVNDQEGQPLEPILEIINNPQTPALSNKLATAFGCGDRSYALYCNAVDIVEDFLLQKGAKIIVPPLKVDSYYFEQNENDDKVVAWAKILSETLKS